MTRQASSTVRVPRRRSRRVDRAHPVYELDLWLVDSEPPIWRSLAVPADFRLSALHDLIQVVMGWEDYHLHGFETLSGMRFEPVRQVGGVDAMWAFIRGDEHGSVDEAGTTLRDLFEDLKETLCYQYDFGDDWTHGIKLIDTHADRSGFDHLPICLAGERAGPPEDSGGVWGYEQKLEIIANPDPDDEWHQDVIDWMGGRRFDPERFDLAFINGRIRAGVQRRRHGSGTSRRRGTKHRKRKSR